MSPLSAKELIHKSQHSRSPGATMFTEGFLAFCLALPFRQVLNPANTFPLL
jgi:hypothetical protein